MRLLKTEDTFKIKQLKFYYKYLKNNLPLYFQNLSIKTNNQTHNTRNQDLYKCRIKHEFAKQSLLFSIPETINNCAINIKKKLTTHSIEGMSMYAKNFLLTFYNLECDIPDCYVCVQDVLCYIVFYPACTGRWPDVGSVLARRLRCRPNIYPTLCRRLVFAGYEYKCIILYCFYYYHYSSYYYYYSYIFNYCFFSKVASAIATYGFSGGLLIIAILLFKIYKCFHLIK